MAKIRPLMLLPPVLFLVIVSVFLVGNFREGRDELPSTLVGREAPVMELGVLEGREAFDNDDLRAGEVALVNFWASWCPPCRAEMPSLQRAWEQVGDEGIMVMAVNVGEELEDVQRFLDQLPLDFPLPMDTDSTVTQRWPLRGLPTTFVVGPDGRLVYKAVGEREWDDPEILEQVRALKR